MIDDLDATRPVLWLIAGLMWLALVLNSFWNDDSPIQFRADCSVTVGTYAGSSACRTYLEWVGL